MVLRSIAWPTLVVGMILGIVFSLGIVAGLAFTQSDELNDIKNAFVSEFTTEQTADETTVIRQESGATIPEVVEKTKPAVVTVAIRQTLRREQFLSPWQVLLGEPNLEVPNEPIQQDIGSGFVVDTQTGLVVTNRHVVSNIQAEYIVIDSDGNEHPVKQIYRDPINDLAVLQIDAKLPSLPLGDTDKIRIGESVIAIGTALGEFRQTVTSGIVSGVGRGIETQDGWSVEQIDNLIQTDAAINPGNSGGPLLNDRGEVIGVNVAVARAENIGFALPISAVQTSLDNFRKTGEFSRAYLGVQYRTLTEEAALANEVPSGAYITRVVPDSPADAAGLQPGDILTRIQGQEVSEAKGSVAGILNSLRVGEVVEVEFWREGTRSTISITLQELPESL